MRAWLLCLAFTLPVVAFADGCIMPLAVNTPEYKAGPAPGETDQRSVILWRDGRETLLLQVGYAGPASDLAWVVPVPSMPGKAIPLLSLSDEKSTVVPVSMLVL